MLVPPVSYELSLNAASEGLQQLTDLNIPFRIPADFFAERVKPDKHMARVKDKLIEEQRKMVAVAERKQDKETRRFAKQVQSAKIQEKSAEKKANLAAAGKMRKAPEGADRELGVERSILPGVSAHLAANRADEAARREKKSAKREAKDKKYGHGGKKRNVRKNDKESATSGKDYTVGKMRQNFQGFKDSKPGSDGTHAEAQTHEPRRETNRTWRVHTLQQIDRRLLFLVFILFPLSFSVPSRIVAPARTRARRTRTARRSAVAARAVRRAVDAAADAAASRTDRASRRARHRESKLVDETITDTRKMGRTLPSMPNHQPRT